MLIGIISDIHEDITGLEKALKILDKKGSQEIICLGDIAGYSFPHYKYEKTRDASGCLNLIRRTCNIVLPGNHDLYACRKIPIADPGFSYPDGWYDMDLPDREKLGKDKVWLYEDTELESNYSEADKEYIKGLPEFTIANYDGYKTLLSHYIYPDISGSSTKFLPDAKLIRTHIEFMRQNTCDISFFGHSHVEGIWEIEDGKENIIKRADLNEGNSTRAFGVPCIARGRNQPGATIFDSQKGIIEIISIYPGFKRWLTVY